LRKRLWKKNTQLTWRESRKWLRLKKNAKLTQLPQLWIYACALTAFSACGLKPARVHLPLGSYKLYSNTHNRRRTLAWLDILNEEKRFCKVGESIRQFFDMFNYGTSAMTFQGAIM
jgi:hypothetical protein